MGGLARRATLIQRVRGSLLGPLLIVDAGNTLMGDTLSLQSDGRVITEALNRMGYDALGVGTGEVLKGVDVLLERASEAKFAIVSCNLVWTDSGEPVLEPYVIVEREGIRAALIGISAPTMLDGLEASWPDATVLPPEETLAGYVRQLRAQVDLIVVLSQLGLDPDLELAQEIEGIDVIIGGGTRWLLTEARIVGSTTIVQVGYDGEWLGRLDLPQGGESADQRRYEVLTMRPDVADDPEMKALVQRYYAEYAMSD